MIDTAKIKSDTQSKQAKFGRFGMADIACFALIEIIERAEAAEAQRDELAAQLVTMTNHRDVLHAENCDLISEVERIHGVVDHHIEQREKLAAQLETAQARIAELTALNTELETSVRFLYSMKDDSDQTIVAFLKIELSRMIHFIDGARKEVKS